VPVLGSLLAGRARASREMPEGPAPVSVLRRDALYRRSLAIADVLSAALALVFGVSVLGTDSLLLPVVAVVPLVILVSKIVGLYDRDERVLKKTTLDEAPALFRVATLYVLLVWAAEPVFIDGTLGRDQLLGLWLLLLLAMLASRVTARRVARAVASEERFLVVGDAHAHGLVTRKLERNHGVKAAVVGFVGLGREAAGPPPGALGDLDSLGLVVAEQDIDRVIVAPESSSESVDILYAIRVSKSLGIKVSVLPRLFEVVGSSVEFDELEGLTLLGLRSHGLARSSAALKRGVDLVGAGLGLVLLAPLLLMMAAVVKLDTRGSVFFRQRRMGRADREFRMLKFRTMVEGAENQRAALSHRNEAVGLFKIQDDPRITRTGRFLRRASLDELPQLFNVLRGEMSLVGPRPLVPDEDRHITGWDRRRLLVRPGMTGLWQIFGSARVPLEQMVKIDYLYGANWSLWLDAKIVLRTVPYVLGRRGL